MSKLKAEKIYFTHENGDAYVVDMYLKSEADKVIADLEESYKMEVEQLLMEIAKLKKSRRRSDGKRK